MSLKEIGVSADNVPKWSETEISPPNYGASCPTCIWKGVIRGMQLMGIKRFWGGGLQRQAGVPQRSISLRLLRFMFATGSECIGVGKWVGERRGEKGREGYWVKVAIFLRHVAVQMRRSKRGVLTETSLPTFIWTTSGLSPVTAHNNSSVQLLCHSYSGILRSPFNTLISCQVHLT